ncbi:hypothetical protein AN216_09215 [Streptomyces oceani]|uniref:Uncharacterized protein n=1 Tax=Streptomyces oceani TaxID=1075402 RepID=A0A1E7KKC2_9ACTN|nr:hypothetical protein AN216_09215 [Streptomyces oceani]
MPVGRLTAAHHPLVAGEFLRGGFAVLGVGEVVRVAGGGGGLLDAPVHAEHTARGGERLHLGGDDE